MKIEWNKVTGISQLVAVLLFVAVFLLGIFLGKKVGVRAALGQEVNSAWFACDAGKSIHAVFYKHAVHVALSSGPEMFLPQAISASGARYATDDESLVFWNKGDTAFVTEGGPDNVTYKDCVTPPQVAK
jgi:membrane-bound inhibitor of C-type lysozyme